MRVSISWYVFSYSFSLQSLGTRVAARLEDEEFNGAVHLACSKDSVADDDATIATFKLKHLMPHPDACLSLPHQDDDATCLCQKMQFK